MIFDILPSRSRLFFAAAAVAGILVSAAPRSSAQQQPPEAEVFPLYKAAALDPAPENTMDSSNVAAVTNHLRKTIEAHPFYLPELPRS